MLISVSLIGSMHIIMLHFSMVAVIVCIPPPFFFCRGMGGEGGTSYPIFKKGGLDRTSNLVTFLLLKDKMG